MLWTPYPALIVSHQIHPLSEPVNVVPFPKAGGAFATGAYRRWAPVAIETIQADAGLDIGNTLIGMHLKSVAGPIRLAHHWLGKAFVNAARTRPKFIGGDRAHYNPTLKWSINYTFLSLRPNNLNHTNLFIKK